MAVRIDSEESERNPINVLFER